MDRNYRVNTHNKTISRISTNDRDDRDQNRLWSLPLPVLINRANRWLNASIFGQNREESQCILPVLLLIGISRRSKLIFTGQGLSKACFPHRHARESVHTVINLNARSSGGAPSPPLPSPRSSPIRIAPGVDWNRFTNYRVESSHVNVIFLCTRERLWSLDDLFGEFSFLRVKKYSRNVRSFVYEEIEFEICTCTLDEQFLFFLVFDRIKIRFWTI